jgi:hypothetical protein
MNVIGNLFLIVRCPRSRQSYGLDVKWRTWTPGRAGDTITVATFDSKLPHVYMIFPCLLKPAKVSWPTDFNQSQQ